MRYLILFLFLIGCEENIEYVIGEKDVVHNPGFNIVTSAQIVYDVDDYIIIEMSYRLKKVDNLSYDSIWVCMDIFDDIDRPVISSKYFVEKIGEDVEYYKYRDYFGIVQTNQFYVGDFLFPLHYGCRVEAKLHTYVE